MKIYRMENRIRGKAERKKIRTELSDLAMAAGGEDLLTLSREAVDCYTKNRIIKLQEERLKKLALRHINDQSPLLDGLNREPEFVQAEKLARIAELAIRTAPSGIHNNIYGRVAGFVMNHLKEKF